jgi:hypothetical protein
MVARHRHRRLARAAAALTAVLSTVTAGAVLATREDRHSSARSPNPTVNAPASGVSASLELRQQEWGTAVTMRVTGVPKGTRCRLIAIDRGGHREPVASWQVASDGAAMFRASTALPFDQLDHFKIQTPVGRRLLTIPVRKTWAPAT